MGRRLGDELLCAKEELQTIDKEKDAALDTVHSMKKEIERQRDKSNERDIENGRLRTELLCANEELTKEKDTACEALSSTSTELLRVNKELTNERSRKELVCAKLDDVEKEKDAALNLVLSTKEEIERQRDKNHERESENGRLRTEWLCANEELTKEKDTACEALSVMRTELLRV